MHDLLRASAAFCLLAVLMTPFAVSQEEPKEGDFPKWNTWKLACKGDWIEYGIGENGVVSVSRKYEILDIVEGKITYARKQFDKAGAETSNQELTKPWQEIRLMSSPSKNQKMDWRDDTCEMVGVKLKCRVASWAVKDVNGKDVVTEYWYSIDLPCGGIVKTTTDGAMAAWVTGFAFNGKTNRGADGKPLTATDPMPKFYAKAGNSAVYKLSGDSVSYQKRTVISADADTSKWQAVRCDAEGTAIAGANAVDREQTRKEWHNHYAKPAEKDQKIKVDAGEYTCNLFKEEEMGASIQTWISDGVIIKIVSKKDGKETTLELYKLTLKP